MFLVFFIFIFTEIIRLKSMKTASYIMIALYHLNVNDFFLDEIANHVFY
jgi:hypothetical protein